MSFLQKIIDHLQHEKYLRDRDLKREEEIVQREREIVIHASEQIDILTKKLEELNKDSSNVSLSEYQEVESKLREYEHTFDAYGFDFGLGKRWREWSKNRITSPKYDLQPPLIIKKPPF